MQLLYEVVSRLWERLRTQLASLCGRPPEEKDVVHRRRHHRRRLYTFGRNAQGGIQWLTLAGIALFGVLFLVGAGKLISYGADYLASRRASEELREIYYDTAADELPARPEQTDAPAEVPVLAVETAPEDEAAPISAMDASQTLPELSYPGNPYRIVSSRFTRLRGQNSDIVGWLTINGLIDEAVVQRDNSYYLNRDYLGYHNVNGAIFLDENCSLTKRPYTLLLYGHNMKTGAMFGNLRNYEDLNFYRNNPFITFDTLYEEGRYVIFSVATISLDPENWRYLSFSKLNSATVSKRQEALTVLTRASIFGTGVTVTPQDQILLLITCVDSDEERRVIAARRVREGEEEAALKRMVNQSYMR